MFLYLLSIVYSFSMTIACSKLQDSHVRIVNTDTKNARGLGRERERVDGLSPSFPTIAPSRDLTHPIRL